MVRHNMTQIKIKIKRAIWTKIGYSETTVQKEKVTAYIQTQKMANTPPHCAVSHLLVHLKKFTEEASKPNRNETTTITKHIALAPSR